MAMSLWPQNVKFEGRKRIEADGDPRSQWKP